MFPRLFVSNVSIKGRFQYLDLVSCKPFPGTENDFGAEIGKFFADSQPYLSLSSTNKSQSKIKACYRENDQRGAHPREQWSL
jgi:hypothetical protein